MRKIMSTVLVTALLFEINLFAGIGSSVTMYVGGTLKIKEQTEGKSSTADEKAFVFEYKERKNKTQFTIPYDRMDSLEYGQKAGRRVGMAIVLSPLALLSKKRKHFLTIGFRDNDDKQQAGVFELGKGIVRTTLASLEARSGRKIEYRDEEARLSSKGN